MPTIEQLQDYATYTGLVVIGATPVAHALAKFARGLHNFAKGTETKADDAPAAAFDGFAHKLAKGLDAIVAILPRVTMGRISAQAAEDAVKP